MPTFDLSKMQYSRRSSRVSAAQEMPREGTIYWMSRAEQIWLVQAYWLFCPDTVKSGCSLFTFDTSIYVI